MGQTALAGSGQGRLLKQIEAAYCYARQALAARAYRLQDGECEPVSCQTLL